MPIPHGMSGQRRCGPLTSAGLWLRDSYIGITPYLLKARRAHIQSEGSRVPWSVTLSAEAQRHMLSCDLRIPAHHHPLCLDEPVCTTMALIAVQSRKNLATSSRPNPLRTNMRYHSSGQLLGLLVQTSLYSRNSEQRGGGSVRRKHVCVNWTYLVLQP